MANNNKIKQFFLDFKKGLFMEYNVKKTLNIKMWAYWMIGGVVASVAFYAGFILYLTYPISEYSIAQSGVFGDSFGLLTALFSGLAFAGLIITIRQQREDLILQNNSIDIQNKNLELQREELQATRDEIKIQNFERTFFEMLRLHNSILDSIDLRNKNNKDKIIASGRDCFKTFYNNLSERYSPYILYEENDSLIKIEEIYQDFWGKYKQDLGHYFRYLYRIFKYVNESYITKEQKKLYASTIRAQLSDYETALLFYNCLSSHGNEKFKPLTEKYTLFDNMPKSLMFNLKHEKLYEPEAFVTPKKEDE